MAVPASDRLWRERVFQRIKTIISASAIPGRLARWTPETLMPEKRTRSADQRQQYQPKDE
jgi:hypothetical protein